MKAILVLVLFFVSNLATAQKPCDESSKKFYLDCFYAELAEIRAGNGCSLDGKLTLRKNVCLESKGQITIRCDAKKTTLKEADKEPLEKELRATLKRQLVYIKCSDEIPDRPAPTEPNSPPEAGR